MNGFTEQLRNIFPDGEVFTQNEGSIEDVKEIIEQGDDQYNLISIVVFQKTREHYVGFSPFTKNYEYWVESDLLNKVSIITTKEKILKKDDSFFPFYIKSEIFNSLTFKPIYQIPPKEDVSIEMKDLNKPITNFKKLIFFDLDQTLVTRYASTLKIGDYIN